MDTIYVPSAFHWASLRRWKRGFNWSAEQHVRVIGRIMRPNFQPNADEREGFTGDLNAESGEDSIHHMMTMDGVESRDESFFKRGSRNTSTRFGRRRFGI